MLSMLLIPKLTVICQLVFLICFSPIALIIATVAIAFLVNFIGLILYLLLKPLKKLAVGDDKKSNKAYEYTNKYHGKIH